MDTHQQNQPSIDTHQQNQPSIDSHQQNQPSIDTHQQNQPSIDSHQQNQPSIDSHQQNQDDEETKTAIEPIDPPPETPNSTTESQNDTVSQTGTGPETETETGPDNGHMIEQDEEDPVVSSDGQKSTKHARSENGNSGIVEEDDDYEDVEENHPPKKQKQLSSLSPTLLDIEGETLIKTTPVAKRASTASKKPKKKGNNVWVTTRSSRKGKKKNKTNAFTAALAKDKIKITPAPRLPDKGDDSPDMKTCLSKVYKADKVEVSEDRLTAGSIKGYRMVRATRGVIEGAWYFEIKVVHLGETGHTRLGWCTQKGDLQAPVGYDGNSFGYRDVDGSKIHKASREKYGEEGYKEGDVLGFYINLPDGGLYAPPPPPMVLYKGQRYVYAADYKEEPPVVVPGSEITFFKNGVCQGVAFKDLFGGRYFPAASMYTLPAQPNCVVKFNFGPDFECAVDNFGERPIPKPMIDAPYHANQNRVENCVLNNKGVMVPSSTTV